MKTRTVKLSFIGSQGVELAAALEIPSGRVKLYAIFAHCFTCSKDYFAVNRLSKALAENGIATLRFDFTGLGESGGEFPETNLSTNVADIVSAADFLRREYQAPRVLIGHSLGGAAALLTAKLIPEIESVATIAAPSGAKHLEHVFDPARSKIESEGEATVSIAGRPFTIKKQFLDDISSINLEEALRQFDKRLLIVHSQADRTVGIANAYRIFDTVAENKSVITLKSADHLLTNRDDTDYVGAMLANWILRRTK